MNPNHHKLEQAIAGVLARYPDVTAAYLFGSHAEGREHPGSDVDLALVGSHDRLAEQRLDLLADLVCAGIDNVDLVLLDDADPALRFEAVRHNRLVYARREFDHGSHYSRVVREYFDFEPYLRVQREALKQRLADGAP